MASVDGDGMSDDFSFLDLQNCSPTTKGYLLSLIENESKDAKKQVSSAPKAIPEPNSQPHQPQTHFTQQIYPSPPTSQPYVYINNVTANVNVHHGQPVGDQARGGPSGPVPQGLQPSGFPPPPPNPMFANPPMPVPYLYQHQFAPMAKGLQGPHTPVSGVPGAPPPHAYIPYLIQLPYALPVSQPQLPVSSAPPPPPRGPPTTGILRTTTPMIPVSTAPNEAFYQAQAQVPQTPQVSVPVEVKKVEPTEKDVKSSPPKEREEKNRSVTSVDKDIKVEKDNGQSASNEKDEKPKEPEPEIKTKVQEKKVRFTLLDFISMIF